MITLGYIQSNMNTLIAIAAVIFFFYSIDKIYKYIESRFNTELDYIFLEFKLKYNNFAKHPFVVRSVIPYLMRNGYPAKEIEVLKRKRKKEIDERNSKIPNSKITYTDQELEDQIWNRILCELIEKQIKQIGEDRKLSFLVLNNGSKDNSVVWSNLHKTFINNRSGKGTNFGLELKPSDKKNFVENPLENLLICGETVVHKVGKNMLKLYVVYFYVQPEKKKASDISVSGEYKWFEYSSDIGILIEIPYNFIDGNRDQWFRKKPEEVKKMLKDFNLKSEDERYGYNWISPAGSSYSEYTGSTIGNEYVSLTSR